MCGVVGFVGTFDHEVIERVVEESRVRGLHNLGSRLMRSCKMCGKGGCKNKYCGAGIFHARYITSGLTDQPLVKGNQALAFNGVIHMGTKTEMEKYFDMDLDTDNDGEIALRLGMPQLLDWYPDVSFAGLMLKPGKLLAMRNEKRPLWMHHHRDGVILASTRDIFVRAGLRKNLEMLEPLKLYTWTF